MLRRFFACAFMAALGAVGCGSDDSGGEGGPGGNAGSGGTGGAVDAGTGGTGGTAGTAGTSGNAGTAGTAGQDAGPLFAEFADAKLEACVRDAIQLPDGPISAELMAGLDHLECQDMGITQLDGLELATSLLELSLWENAIADLAPLSGLTQLRDLQLGNNAITDVTPLIGMTGLRRLGLSVNEVSSLAPLAGLVSLEWLNLDRNAFGEGELVHLAGLTNLRWLTIEHNGIQSHTALQPIIDAGCDVYDHHKAVAGTDSILPQLAAMPSVRRPGVENLRVVIGSAGQVALSFDVGGRSLPVRLIGGQLTRKGDSVFQTRAERIVRVGEVRNGKALLCTDGLASTCRVRVGVKWPEAGSKLPGTGDAPVVTMAVDLTDAPATELLDGEAWTAADQDILPYVLASPNQFDAGSCLFMANTGAMEVLMNQHVPVEDVAYEGDTDLSERFLMAAGYHAPASTVPYDLTDVLYYYEALGGALLNRDYNFCAGYVKENANGSIVPSTSADPNAELSCSYNWFDMFPDDWESLLVPTPLAERTTIFVDPKRDDNSQWRVALFDDDTIEQIKYELRTKNAPVIVVYNHYLYWHANVIVGYDDAVDSNGCPMVEDSIAYFKEKGFTSYATAIENHMAENGGCSDYGVFYVRDSIYDGGTDEPYYDYSTADVSIQKERYSKRIVELSYNWAKYLGNHTYTVHRRGE